MFNSYYSFINTLVIYFQYYLMPYYYLCPVWLQLMTISIFAFSFEFFPFFTIAYYMLINAKFNLFYSLIFIISGIIGTFGSDSILFRLTDIKNNTLMNSNNIFIRFIKYLTNYPLILFTLYRIIPYSRSIVILILSNTYDKNKFYKWNLITAIMFSLSVFSFLYAYYFYI